MINISNKTMALLRDNAKILRQRDKDDIFMQQWIKMGKSIPTVSKSNLMKESMIDLIDNMDVDSLVGVVTDLTTIGTMDSKSAVVDINMQDIYTCEAGDQLEEFSGRNVATLMDTMVQSCADRLVDETYRSENDDEYETNIDAIDLIDRLPVSSLNLINGKLHYRRYNTECDDEMRNSIDEIINIVDDRWFNSSEYKSMSDTESEM